MLFSQTTEYALRAMVYLARQSGSPQPTQDIAAEMQVPPSYLAKVMQALGRAELVTSRRGLHGGFVLGRDPEQITLLEIVDAVDPIERIQTCPLGLPEHDPHLCPLHRRLDDAISHVQKAFASTRLSELTDEPRVHVRRRKPRK